MLEKWIEKVTDISRVSDESRYLFKVDNLRLGVVNQVKVFCLLQTFFYLSWPNNNLLAFFMDQTHI